MERAARVVSWLLVPGAGAPVASRARTGVPREKGRGDPLSIYLRLTRQKRAPAMYHNYAPNGSARLFVRVHCIALVELPQQ
jgi:hypothetical protein